MAFRKISVEKGLEESAAARSLRQAGLAPESVESKPEAADYRRGKEALHIAPKKGAAFGVCASLDNEYVCCNVQTLASVSNCPYDCSYCFLQNYLTDGTLTEVGDVMALAEEVRIKTAAEPERFFRIGSWTLGDSLALEPLTGGGAALIHAFATMPTVLLELKTKSANVDSLLGVDHGGRVVLSWSLNPPAIIAQEELKTASLDERLDAMARAADAGYLISIHFDPMIHFDGWEEEYPKLAERLFSVVAPERVVWISMGSLRFNPEMKRSIEERFPKSRLTTAEMVLGPDGKMRYPKVHRVTMYDTLYKALREAGGKDLFVYLCMERWDVWERVFGVTPVSTEELDWFITRSLHRRFPGLMKTRPRQETYVTP